MFKRPYLALKPLLQNWNTKAFQLGDKLYLKEKEGFSEHQFSEFEFSRIKGGKLFLSEPYIQTYPQKTISLTRREYKILHQNIISKFNLTPLFSFICFKKEGLNFSHVFHSLVEKSHKSFINSLRRQFIRIEPLLPNLAFVVASQKDTSCFYSRRELLFYNKIQSEFFHTNDSQTLKKLEAENEIERFLEAVLDLKNQKVAFYDLSKSEAACEELFKKLPTQKLNIIHLRNWNYRFLLKFFFKYRLYLIKGFNVACLLLTVFKLGLVLFVNDSLTEEVAFQRKQLRVIKSSMSEKGEIVSRFNKYLEHEAILETSQALHVNASSILEFIDRQKPSNTWLERIESGSKETRIILNSRDSVSLEDFKKRFLEFFEFKTFSVNGLQKVNSSTLSYYQYDISFSKQ